MKNYTTTFLFILFSSVNVYSQSPYLEMSASADLTETDPTGYYILLNDTEEKDALAYYHSGPVPYECEWSGSPLKDSVNDLAPGVYTILITDDNIRMNSETSVVSFNAGINPQDPQSDILLFPNPARDYFLIDAGTGKIHKAEILNIVGQVVYTGTASGSKIYMNTNEIDAGMYLVRIYVNDIVVTKKVYVVR